MLVSVAGVTSKSGETGFLGCSARGAPWSAGACSRFGAPGGAPLAGSALPANKAAASLPQAIMQSGKGNMPDYAGDRAKMTSTGSNRMDHRPLAKGKERRTNFDNN
jgi:hypothetical protein